MQILSYQPTGFLNIVTECVKLKQMATDNVSSEETSSGRKYCCQCSGTMIVLIWSCLAYASFASLTLYNSPFVAINYSGHSDIFKLSGAITSVSFLFYPLIGYLGEKWTRFKVMVAGTCIFGVAFVVTSILDALNVSMVFSQTGEISSIVSLVLSFILYLSFGLFEANVIQFGTDQLMFAPSHELSKFVYWFVWVIIAPSFLCNVISIVIGIASSDKALSSLYVLSISVSAGLVLALAMVCCCRRKMVTEPPTRADPIKQIWLVMKYAWRHRVPECRSAFTYGEPHPSRLDLGKGRFGGPFTTEEVEDVKTFWQIFIVLLLIFGLNFVDSTSGPSLQYLNLKASGDLSYLETVVLVFPDTLTNCVPILAIPLLQCCIVPCCSHCIPNMLRRLWVSVAMVLVQLTIVTGLSIANTVQLENFAENITVCGEPSDNLDDGEIEVILSGMPPFYLLIVPQILRGLAMLLAYVTALEFILAQGPRHVQGFLIGIWFMYRVVYFAGLTLSISSTGCRWEYYCAKCCAVLLSLVLYSVAAKRYKYRIRNELADINERVVIAQYHSRYLDLREEDRELTISITSL